MNYTAIIVDDEAHAIRTLTAQLGWAKVPVEVIGTAMSVAEAGDLLTQTKPDFIFLDIKMPGQTGFDLFPMIDEKVTDVIFTTAHDEFALKAFKHQASGYLMKPVSTKELKALLEKLINRRGALAENRQDIIIEEKGGTFKIPADCLLYISAESGYVILHFDDASQRTVSKLLKDLQNLLADKGFERCHNKYLVNMKQVVELKKARNATLKLSDGTVLPVSRSRKTQVYTRFDAVR